MTRPKNPYSDDTLNTRRMVWDEGYAAGLPDGEKQLARALKRYLATEYPSLMFSSIKNDIEDWLTARLKRGKK